MQTLPVGGVMTESFSSEIGRQPATHLAWRPIMEVAAPNKTSKTDLSMANSELRTMNTHPVSLQLFELP